MLAMQCYFFRPDAQGKKKRDRTKKQDKSLGLLPRDLELAPHLLLAKSPRVPFQHRRALLQGHGHLLGADGNKASRQRVVVLEDDQAHRDHDVVNVVEDEGALGSVVGAGLQKGSRVVAPVAERVQVVRGVVAVVEAVAVALGQC